MRKINKKLLGLLACSGALMTSVAVSNKILKPKLAVTVHADQNNVAARSYGVDISSYQSSDVTNYATNGGQFAIVKVSEGTSYRNPKATAQISSAVSNNI